MNQKKKPSLVEQHAMNRLHKVEKEHRKPFVKHVKKDGFNFSSFFILILLVMLVYMMLSPLISGLIGIMKK